MDKKQSKDTMKEIGFWLTFAGILILILIMIGPVRADSNITATPTATEAPTTSPTPTITPQYTFTPLPTPAATIAIPVINLTTPKVPNGTDIKRIQQGDPVFVNETYDISGVVGWAGYLAWYNGNEPDAAATPYTLQLPNYKRQYYEFYLDPVVFKDKLGDWYQYYGHYESAGNLLAFTVLPESMKPVFRLNQSTNITMAENQTKINATPVPIKHIADYLIARGDKFNISVPNPTHMWLFGTRTGIFDFRSINGTININTTMIEGLEPGSYKMMLQTANSSAQDFTVRYNAELQTFEWFGSYDFRVHSFEVAGLTPRLLYEKIKEVRPKLSDNFTEYDFELQEPMISIIQIDPKTVMNESVYMSGQEFIRNDSFLDVKGYTNVAPGTVLTFVLDKELQTPQTLPKATIMATAQGNYGGDMRYFHVIIPIDKYNAAHLEHSLTATTRLGGSTTASYFIYDMPPDSYIPDQTIRYIAGKYGDVELVPTPPPVIVNVTQTVVVTKTVTIPVTPSDAQVKKQQEIVIAEKWNQTSWLIIEGIIAIAVIGYCAFWGIRYYRKRREEQ